MGAWPFAGGRLAALFAGRLPVSVSSRRESGSPAAGSLSVHQQEQEDLVARALHLPGS
jgi:2-oxoglutarate dehydrogenase complex dehydrogenase (E1) component-like enzyme